MKLVVGLGNPGKEYESTRHNIGFMIVDNYIKQEDWKSKFEGFYQIINKNGEKILFLKPQTYMNTSGDSIIKFMNYFDIEVQDILVIQDDMDLEIGDFKLKRNSSSGGHNGIKSIIQNLHNEEFLRLKVGISHEKNGNTINHVLGKFSKSEMEVLQDKFSLYNEIIDNFIQNGVENTINNYNSRR